MAGWLVALSLEAVGRFALVALVVAAMVRLLAGLVSLAHVVCWIHPEDGSSRHTPVRHH